MCDELHQTTLSCFEILIRRMYIKSHTSTWPMVSIQTLNLLHIKQRKNIN